jgi:hypothetical protein
MAPMLTPRSGKIMSCSDSCRNNSMNIFNSIISLLCSGVGCATLDHYIFSCGGFDGTIHTLIYKYIQQKIILVNK